MEKMNPEAKKLWIEALRSGEYQQTRSVLHDDNGFCCLGVLCDVAMKNWDIMSEWRESTEEERDAQDVLCDGPAYAFLGQVNVLPEQVMEWAGLEKNNPDVHGQCDDEDCACDEGGEWTVTLAELNDDGRSFSEIADMIEDSL
jgi:hypothetical protein